MHFTLLGAKMQKNPLKPPCMGKRKEISIHVSLSVYDRARHKNYKKQVKHPIWENRTILRKRYLSNVF